MKGIKTFRDILHLKELYNGLLTTRVTDLNTVNERKEKNTKVKVFMRDLNAIRLELSETTQQELIVGAIKPFLEQIYDLRKRISQLQAIDNEVTVFSQVEEEIVNEDGGDTLVAFKVPEWLLRVSQIFKSMDI